MRDTLSGRRGLRFSVIGALLAVVAVSASLGCAAQRRAACLIPRTAMRWEPPRLAIERRAKFEELVPELDKLLAEDHRANGAPGMAVGIVVGGETVYARGFGLRDVEQNQPFTADTPFPIASVTKSFAAMAILRLRDAGEVDLDVPAERYYRPLAKVAYPTRDAPRITLRHLLTHSSGMPEDNPWADVTENLTDADLAALLDGGAMSRVPGVQFEYANIGYAVLGRVIERVSGMPAREYIRRAILEPLGMTHGGWEPEQFPAGTLALGYRGREGAHDIAAPRVVAPAERLGVMDAAGGLYTTVNDLARYVAFHVTAWPPRDDVESGPLKRSSVREMQQGMRIASFNEFIPRLAQRWPPETARLGSDGVAFHAFAYGFGLLAHQRCEREIFVEHSGGLPGYATFVTMIPEAGIGLMVFLNDERARSKALDVMLKVLRKGGFFVAPPITPHPALATARFAVSDLLSSWSDAQAQAIFEPSFFRYQTIGALKETFATMARAHGPCRESGRPSFVNRLRGSWTMTCERGSIKFAAGLAPGPKPRLQGLEWQEDMPPSPELERAGAAMGKFLDQGDSAAAAPHLSKAFELPALERNFAAVGATHHACKIERPVESDGKTRATFLLACRENPLELTVFVDAAGKVTQATARAPRSEERPNCAE